MLTTEFRCFCRKCHADFVTTTNIDTKEVTCPTCKHEHDFGHVSRHWIEVGRNIKKLKKDLANLHFYTRVEFEHDFKQYDGVNAHFQDYCELCKKESILYSFRSDIVAFKFKFQDRSTFTLNDESIFVPSYDVPLHLQESANFQTAIEKPHLYVYEEEATYSHITLHDFALVAFHLKQYRAYHQRISETLAFYPMFVFQ